MSRCVLLGRAGRAVRRRGADLRDFSVALRRGRGRPAGRVDEITVVEVEMPETLDKHWGFSIKGGAASDQYVANTKVFKADEGVRRGIRYDSYSQTLQSVIN